MLVPVFFIVACLSSCNIEPSQEVKSKYFLTKDEQLLLQEGDIVLRHGYGMVSNMISATLKEDIELSHCAIIIKDSTDKFKVVHSVSQSVSDYDGVQIQDLNLFINDSKPNSVVVVRYKNLSPEQQLLIRKKSLEFLKQQIPFDHSFDISDSTEFYCTELIWRIFLDLFNDDILQSDKFKHNLSAFRFAFFFDPKRFEVIIDHHKKLVHS